MYQPGTFLLSRPIFNRSLLQDWKLKLERIVDGISACLLSLKRQPFIRYSGKSGQTFVLLVLVVQSDTEMAQKVVAELQRR